MKSERVNLEQKVKIGRRKYRIVVIFVFTTGEESTLAERMRLQPAGMVANFRCSANASAENCVDKWQNMARRLGVGGGYRSNWFLFLPNSVMTCDEHDGIFGEVVADVGERSGENFD